MTRRQITSVDVATLPLPGTTSVDGFRFSPDDTLITYLRSPNQSLKRQLCAFDLQSKSEFIYTGSEKINDLTEDELSLEEKLRRERQRIWTIGITKYQWCSQADKRLMLIPIANDLYVHDKNGLRLVVDGSQQPAIIDPKLSPDGCYIAYVQDAELHCVPTEGAQGPRRLTFDARGRPGITNGLAEFIAQEEMDRCEGFWWSNDSRFIAFTQVDESHIPSFYISHSGSTNADTVEEHRYPFAGKSNAKVTVGIIDVQDNVTERPPISWVDLSSMGDHYVARVDFFPDQSLALQIENRQQTKLSLFKYDFLRSKNLQLLIEETSSSWINLHDHFRTLKKTPDQFIWASERSGFMHLELRDYATGNLIRQLTSGQWVVQRVADIDETNGNIYFTANRETPIEIHLYVVNYKVDQPEVDRITTESGCHDVYCFSRSFNYCLTQWNSIDQYPVTRLLDVKTKTIVENFTFLHEAQEQSVKQYDLMKPKFIQIQNRNQDTLHGIIYIPEDVNQRYQRPYPTLISVYGGPHAQRVTNTWAQRVDMRSQRLVQAGYVVLRLDNRGSSNRGLAFESVIKHDMGNLELQDQIDGVNYLVKQGITDKTRVGMYGWSYGGYMSAMAVVRASDVFKLAISGAPVTHWDGYDTHYTERYMGTPEENPLGYEVSSVMHHVHNLKGHLLLIHGLIDENVHFRHTARLINALIHANKPYDIVILPDERHMCRKLDGRVYTEDRIFEYIKKNL